ncbi:MAG: hypothetical protein E3J43_02810 [Candidatus Heimdallarchaeota archaeon]|nr:MAG: hypothetical protein E3J43_02810 [Candidatus Heimdallarchaeota archaeon]
MAQSSAPFGFKVTQRILALRATYDIIDVATGNKVFIAKRRMFTWRPTIIIENIQGQEVAKITANYFFQNKWKITVGPDLIGEIEFPIIKFCGIKFDIMLAGNQYTASDVFGWSFKAVGRDGVIGFTLDKKFFRIKDTYRVDVYPPLEPLFGLAAVLAIDSRYYRSSR